MADHRVGFESLREETQAPCPVEGTLPSWLHGTLVRTGPAQFEAGGVSMRHWFDGLAMLRAFRFDGRGGRVTYANRFLRSTTYRRVHEDGQLTATEFATDPCRSIFGRVMSMFRGRGLTDNGNVNVGRLAGQYVARTETPLPVAFDPETLETLGVVDPGERVQGTITTAHPQTDPDTGVTYTYFVDFGKTSTYRVYARDDGSAREMASIDVERPAYMHSFGMTENHLILAEFPLVVNPLRMLFMPFTGEAFIETYRWRPERGTRFTILDTSTGDVVARPQGPPLFAFHHVNAFERDDAIHLDVAAYDDPSIIDAFYLDRLRSGDAIDPAATLTRYTLPLNGGAGRASGAVTSDVRAAPSLELPRIHDAYAGRAYRYAYGVGAHAPGHFQDQLVKVDVETGDAQTWHEPGTYAGEAIFVPHPRASERGDAEDDGVVLSVVLDAERETSFLLVLDAATFDEIARAEAPHAIPFGLHGAYWES